jgi:uncharacterized protein (DUF3820 family)
MVVEFGKYQGKMVSEIPEDYFKWAKEKLEEARWNVK